MPYTNDQIRLIGDPLLRQRSEPVTLPEDTQLSSEKERLANILNAFRKEKGFGRAISAPQIGILKRFIALNLGDSRGTFFIHNPRITYASEELFTMWDDCLSFPWLLVKVIRHKSISIQFENESGAIVHWNKVDQGLSELLQHEIDHLDGILAVDRVVNETNSILGVSVSGLISRDVYERNPDFFHRQVDYFIVSTLDFFTEIGITCDVDYITQIKKHSVSSHNPWRHCLIPNLGR